MKTLLSRFWCILFSSICSPSCIGWFLLNKNFKSSPSTKQYRGLDNKCQLYDSGKKQINLFSRHRTSASWISALSYSCCRKASSLDVLSCGFLTIISGYDSFNKCCLWSYVYVFCIFNVACSRTWKWRQNTSKVLWCAAMADMVGELLLGSVECIALFVNDNYHFCLVSIDCWICYLCWKNRWMP